MNLEAAVIQSLGERVGRIAIEASSWQVRALRAEALLREQAEAAKEADEKAAEEAAQEAEGKYADQA